MDFLTVVFVFKKIHPKEMQPGTERVLFLLLETDEWFSLAVCSGNY